MQRLARLTALGLMFYGAAILGCGPSESASTSAPTGGEAEHEHAGEEHDHDHAHDHEAHGPHGGHLIELGNEEYHAEWTHDPADQENAKNVTVYLLGSDAKTETPIAAESITINVTGGKEPKQYQLAAVNAKDGKASQFALDDAALVVDLGMVGEGVEARLNVSIDGTPYSAAIEHEHGHDHDHEH